MPLSRELPAAQSPGCPRRAGASPARARARPDRAQDAGQQERAIGGPLRGERIRARRGTRQHVGDDLAQYPIGFGRGKRRRFADRVAAVQAIEIEGTPYDHGLGKRRSAQAEVPIVVEAEIAESAERAEEFAVDEKVAGGHGNVALQRAKLLSPPEQAALELPIASCRRGSIGRFLRLVTGPLARRVRSPMRPRTGDAVHQRFDAIRRKVVVGIEERDVFALRERGAFVEGRRRAAIGPCRRSSPEDAAARAPCR